VKVDVAYVNCRSQWHAKGLNAAIQVLVIQGILVVPDSSSWIADFITHKPNAVICWIGLDLVHCRARPSHNGRLHPKRGAKRRKREVRCPADGELTVRRVVEHVALARVRLAPSVFGRCDILRFGKIGRTLVQRCVQVIDLNANPVRYAVVIVAGVVVGIRRKVAGERIDPGT